MTRPYLNSAINFYNTLEKRGFAKVNNDQVDLDFENFEAINNALDDYRNTFIEILDAEDEANGAKLQEIESSFKVEGNLVQWMVKRLA